jgi:hypothetical protein
MKVRLFRARRRAIQASRRIQAGDVVVTLASVRPARPAPMIE